MPFAKERPSLPSPKGRAPGHSTCLREGPESRSARPRSSSAGSSPRHERSRRRRSLSSNKPNGWATMSASSLLSSAGCQTPLTRVLEEKDEGDAPPGDPARERASVGLSSALNRMEDSIQTLLRRRSGAAPVVPKLDLRGEEATVAAPVPMTRCSDVAQKSEGYAERTLAGADRQELFSQLRCLAPGTNPPPDPRHVASLALRGAELCRGQALSFRQHALLAFRLERLNWFSQEVLVTALASSGQLSASLGAQILRALQQLPTEAEEALLIRLAVALAAADVGHSDFYRKVLDAVGAPKTDEEWMEEEASDHWRLSLLFFLAKAGSAGRWSLVLNILRKLPAKHEGLEELAAHVPKSLIPKLLQLLQLNSLENDALLLEARPFASSLCKAWRTCQTAQAAEPGAAEDSSDTKSLEVLAKMASAAGYLGVIDLQTAEAIWKQIDDLEIAEAITSSDQTRRLLLQAGWASCVARCHDPEGRQRPGFPGASTLLSLMKTTSPPSANRHQRQQIRQVALSFATESWSSGEGRLPGLAWLGAVGRAFFTPHRWNDQLRLAKAFAGRLRSLGVFCRAEPSWKSVGAKAAAREAEHAERAERGPEGGLGVASSEAVVYTPKEGEGPEGKPEAKKVLRLTLWAKHPLLLLSEGNRTELGAHFRGCCLNGFEAVEWFTGPNRVSAHVLLLLRSDSKSRDASAAAEHFARRHLAMPEEALHLWQSH
eukprot:g30509.t1